MHNKEPLHFWEGRNMRVHWHWTMMYAPATLIYPQNSPSVHFGINPWLVCLNQKKSYFFSVTTKITKSDIVSRNIHKLMRNICTYSYLQTINLYLNSTALSLFSEYQFTFIISSQVVIHKIHFCHPQNYPKNNLQ